MKLIVGLGNPGREYEATLHNVGFRSADRLIAELNAVQPKQMFKSVYVKTEYRGHPVIILKPMTYMNLSGGPVGEFSRYFHIQPSSVLVISDDLDLPPGTLRYREKGSHGGHNGLRDIIAHIGQDFHRLRIGIGRPPDKEQVKNYVLSAHGAVKDSIERALDAIPACVFSFIEGKPVNIPNPDTVKESRPANNRL